MTSIILCGDGAQPAEWCPSSPEDALPSILALLPPGPAWDAANDPDSTMGAFWKSIADVTAWVYQLLCLYLNEFFCDTVDQSIDQWIRCYALGDNCDPFGYNLCAKVTAVGGANCDYFVEVAHNLGYVITCESLADRPQPIAGQFLCGCTMLGVTPTVIGDGAEIGFGELCACDYGPVTDHPEPDKWDATLASTASCPVPGTSLGQASGAPDCCFIVGYRPADIEQNTTGVAPSPCVDDSYIIEFPSTNSGGAPAFDRGACADSTGSFVDYGDSFTWKITIDLPASYALQGVTVASAPQSNAGNFMAGCTPLCADSTAADFIQCFLNSIKPAHTELIFEVQQP
jgi:uncharacterized protein YmfQ (DUF2313 family)